MGRVFVLIECVTLSFLKWNFIFLKYEDFRNIYFDLIRGVIICLMDNMIRRSECNPIQSEYDVIDRESILEIMLQIIVH